MTIAELPALTVPSTRKLDGLPVVIIGAGPVGLAAAAQLLERDVDVLEAGESSGASVLAWGHTKLATTGPASGAVGPGGDRCVLNGRRRESGSVCCS